MTTALGDSTQTGAGADDFRRRLLEGLARAIIERGYRDTTVADIVRHAKTSKRTFYDQFASKAQCFIELLRTNNEDMISGIQASIDPEAAPRAQVDAALAAYIDHIASHPAITLSWIREAPALGDQALPLHRRAMDDLADMLVAISASPGFEHAGLHTISRDLALILLGGLREVTASYVEEGRDVRGIAESARAATYAMLGLIG